MTKSLNPGSPLLNKIIDDAGYSNKPKWEDLDKLHKDVSYGVIQVAMKINEAINYINSSGKSIDPEVRLNITTIKNNIDNDFVKELIEIKDKFRNKSGYIEIDSPDFDLQVEVFNDLNSFHDKFKALTFEPILSITEAIIKLKSTDVNVVTDVVVKEISTEKAE